MTCWWWRSTSTISRRRANGCHSCATVGQIPIPGWSMARSAAIRGVLPLVPTPFRDDDEIDEGSLRHLIDHYVDAGAHGLTLLGVASEVLKLDDSERRKVMRIAIDQAAGRV